MIFSKTAHTSCVLTHLWCSMSCNYVISSSPTENPLITEKGKRGTGCVLCVGPSWARGSSFHGSDGTIPQGLCAHLPGHGLCQGGCVGVHISYERTSRLQNNRPGPNYPIHHSIEKQGSKAEKAITVTAAPQLSPATGHTSYAAYSATANHQTNQMLIYE